jgi:hypothetical protein
VSYVLGPLSSKPHSVPLYYFVVLGEPGLNCSGGLPFQRSFSVFVGTGPSLGASLSDTASPCVLGEPGWVISSLILGVYRLPSSLDWGPRSLRVSKVDFLGTDF